MWNPFSKLRPSHAVKGIVDMALARVAEWELRLYTRCEAGVPYLALSFNKRPTDFIDLDGDGKSDA